MTDPRNQFRSKNPRANGVVCLVLAAALVAISAVLMITWTFAGEATLVAPISALLVLALLAAVIGLLAFRVAAEPGSTASLARPVQVTTILVFVLGFVGAVGSLVAGAVTGSFATIGAAIGVGVVAFAVATQGAMVYGTARHQG